jgi:hypothetical protein
MPIKVIARSARPCRAALRLWAAPCQAVVLSRAERWRARVVLPFVLLAAAGCASLTHHALPDPVDLRPMPIRAGTGLGGTRVIVLPLSMIRHGDLFGWSNQITDPRAYLIDLNAQMQSALTQRVPRPVWVFPSTLVQVASHNPGYLSDPYGMDPSQFAPDRFRKGDKLEDPLAEDLRGYTSFVDARVVLIPVELRFLPRRVPKGHELPDAERTIMRADSAHHMERAVLRLAVVDTRTTEVMWVGDVVGDPMPAFSPAVGTNLVDHLVQALTSE